MKIIADQKGFSIESAGERWFRYPANVAVNANGIQDRDDPFVQVLGFEEREEGGKKIYCWRSHSDLWMKKEYVLEVEEHAARFFVRVEGQGMVDSLRFFPSGAKYDAAGYFLPVANHADYQRNLRMVHEPAVIELGYFAPPSYVYPFYMADCGGWLGVGLAARAGQYNFHQFLYSGSAGSFEVPLYGLTRVDGEWESQSLIFVEGADAYDVVKAYADWHYASGWCVRKNRESEPAWWKKPIFCGWGEQGALSSRKGTGNAKLHATQPEYDWMMDRLDEVRLEPGVVIIDDKWQDGYGSSLPDAKLWPDLRAFADAQHAKGRKVVLWFRSWDPEGLAHDECIEYLCTACAADPTSEKYRARMKETIRILLSDEEGCMNCDGFKIDFANCMPLGKYVTCHERGVYGVELLKRFFVMMRDFAKAAKKDALINCSIAHPYFDEIVDQCRMHDYDGRMRNTVEIYAHRVKLAAAALPEVLIDMDGGGVGSKRDFYRWTNAQWTMGIPDLYNLTACGDVAFNEADFDLIRSCWAQYEEKLGLK